MHVLYIFPSQIKHAQPAIKCMVSMEARATHVLVHDSIRGYAGASVQRAKQGHRHVILFALAGSARQPKREAEEKCFARALDGTVPIMRNTPGTTVAVAIDDDRKPAGTCLLASSFVSSSFSREEDAWVHRCGLLISSGIADGAACVCMVQLASA
jgi:hypothetical protein